MSFLRNDVHNVCFWHHLGSVVLNHRYSSSTLKTLFLKVKGNQERKTKWTK